MSSWFLKRSKKGFTLAELLIAIVLLSVIMAAVSGIFSVAIRNYQVSFAQSGLQKDLNLVIDGISGEVKQSIEVPEQYQDYQRSSTLLILSLPAIDSDNNFIYDGQNIERDTIVYQLEESNLIKTVIASEFSRRYFQPQSQRVVLEDVSALTFSYSPSFETVKVEADITLSRYVSRTNLEVSASAVAIRRNFE